MANDNTPQGGPIGGLLNRGLGMLFGNSPKAKRGMTPPPIVQAPPLAPKITPEQMGSGLLANSASALSSRQAQLDQQMQDAGAN